MQRPRFRIWDTLNDCWYKPTYLGYIGKIEELLLCPSGDLVMRTYHGMMHESLFKDRFIVQQFIGKKDRNGVDIYQGDICRLKWEGYCYDESWVMPTRSCIAEVRYQPSKGFRGFSTRDTHKNNPLRLTVRGTEVIGNIFETPELLKEVV